MIEDELVHHCGDGHEGDFGELVAVELTVVHCVCDHCGARYDVVRGPARVVWEVGECSQWEVFRDPSRAAVTLVRKTTEAG